MNKVSAFMLVAIMCLSLVACGKTSTKDTGNDATTETSTTQPAQETSYQSVLDTYSTKIKDATPKLVEEYNNEAANNTNGMQGLAKISNDKIAKLAEISNEGIGEMAKIMNKTGSGNYSEYEEWAGKLTDVYMTEAQKITDAYMSSAT